MASIERLSRVVLRELKGLQAVWSLRKDAVRIQAAINKEGGFFRKGGTWYQQDIEHYAETVAQVPGAFAEIGVRHGTTFRKLVPIALAQGKTSYAVDSFEGTKQSSAYDARPDYDMSIGGADVFFGLMDKGGFARSDYQALVGWIPEVFEKFPDDIRFSFVILDVDNYTPTVDSLAFVWQRITPGGVLLLDDFVTYHQLDAGRAIRELLRDNNDYWLERVPAELPTNSPQGLTGRSRLSAARTNRRRRTPSAGSWCARRDRRST